MHKYPLDGLHPLQTTLQVIRVKYLKLTKLSLPHETTVCLSSNKFSDFDRVYKKYYYKEVVKKRKYLGC